MIKRIESIDFLRGIVVILMLLDHVRDLFHIHSIDQSPTDLSVTTPSIFYTRIITHLCAPIFVFLAGSSAFLVGQRSVNKKQFSQHMIRRGAWLILLDLTVVNFGLFFDIRFGLVLVDVLSAIGFSMVIIGLISRYTSKQIFILAISIILIQQFLYVAQPTFLKPLSFLISPNAFPLPNGTLLVVGYPPISWLGISLLGYSMGHYFLDKTHAEFAKLGLSLCLLFLLVRFVNLGGDSPWQIDGQWTKQVMSFLNVAKYPPSISFTMLTLGIMFLLLSGSQFVGKKGIEILSTFGRVPLFFFVSHWFVLHLILFVFIFNQGFSRHDLEFGFQLSRPKSFIGLSLSQVYMLWLAVALLYFPLCRFYYQWQQKRKMNQLS
ncbi:DUF1624 domain-containing protein [Aquirufa ecclesiirivi]|uniref:DUF1624 domain-containing protein n=1 Tax=Aquirufa ecclesiirivi TaxID=2715124 RepID=A0ABT4JHE9_9BACT|nr:heparan-alpha-glucosaminide N-acetyltransferase domain-containing protein [Aquirufa ecclesiirivi]MCZ2474986.1 DUF1624 domain-containing protein [Aquirufa ecclesiirivi]NHC48022.1 DUF1624 domain-containing protein [Aquirufa ecclesiirivi]